MARVPVSLIQGFSSDVHSNFLPYQKGLSCYSYHNRRSIWIKMTFTKETKENKKRIKEKELTDG